MEDSEIIGLFFSRSEEAVARTAEKYGTYCRSIARNILASREDTEECLNDTWLAAWDSIPPQRPDRLSVYLGRITRNLALNRLKSQTAQKRGGGQAEAVLEELRDCIGADPWDEKLTELLRKTCDLTPAGIIKKLELRRPIYGKTAMEGHFGVDSLPWEQTDLVSKLQALAN